MLKDDSPLYSKERAEWKYINHYLKKTAFVSFEIFLIRKNLKDEVRMQKNYGLIAKMFLLQNSTSVFENLMPDAERKDLKG